MRRSAWRRAAACVVCCGRETQGRQMQRAADCEVLLCTTAVHDPVSITTPPTCTANDYCLTELWFYVPLDTK